MSKLCCKRLVQIIKPSMNYKLPSKVYDFHSTVFSGGDFDWCEWGESWYLGFGICCTQGCISNKISSDGGSDSHCCQLDRKESWKREIAVASFWYFPVPNHVSHVTYYAIFLTSTPDYKANDLHDDHISTLSFSGPIILFFFFLFCAFSGPPIQDYIFVYKSFQNQANPENYPSFEPKVYNSRW